MTPEEHDELWHALGVLSRLSKDEELSRLVPGLEAVSDVLTEQVGEALNKLKQSGARVLRGRSMTVTPLGPDGKPTGPPASVGGGGFVNITVGERPTGAEYEARLAAARRKRGIGR